jgi:hypothetical protein
VPGDHLEHTCVTESFQHLRIVMLLALLGSIEGIRLRDVGVALLLGFPPCATLMSGGAKHVAEEGQEISKERGKAARKAVPCYRDQ